MTIKTSGIKRTAVLVCRECEGTGRVKTGKRGKQPRCPVCDTVGKVEYDLDNWDLSIEIHSAGVIETEPEMSEEEIRAFEEIIEERVEERLEGRVEERIEEVVGKIRNEVLGKVSGKSETSPSPKKTSRKKREEIVIKPDTNLVEEQMATTL